MAVILLRFVFLAICLPFIAAQQTNGSVAVGASLTAASNVKPWLSSSGEFAFGFQQVQGNDKFLLSIWYDKIPDKTIIWYPKAPTVPTGSKVELNAESGLVLSDPQGRQVWTSGPISDPAFGSMNDTGNFVIVGDNSLKIWDSFDSPSDTLLPTQVMLRGGAIISKMSNTNFSGGRFLLQLLQDGNLVLNTRDIPTGNVYDAYYSSGTNIDGSNSTNSTGERVIFDETGYLYILRVNGQRFDLTPRGILPSGDYYHRVTLDYDGVLRQYYYPMNPNGNTSWEVIWFEPENICMDIGGNKDSGACGFNNVCTFDRNRRNCECPQGFSLLDPNDPNGDCKLDYTPTCDGGESNNTGDMFDFIELNGINWPQSDYVHMKPTNEQSCKSSCAEDCFCAVAVYADAQCWKKRLPLSNGRKEASSDGKTFLKFRKDNPRPQANGTPPPFSVKNKDQRSLVLVESALLGTSVFVNMVLIGVVCVGFFVIYKKKARKIYPSGNAIETNLPHFTYQELVKATDGFKDVLGKGAFGIVYKGVIGKKMVAVKKLNSLLQDGEKEFKTESLVLECDNEGVAVLTDLAWDYYQEGRLDVFVDNDFEALDDYKKLKSFVMVGLWCIQDNSALRPTMRKVVQMLEGEIEVAEPPSPCALHVNSKILKLRRKSGKKKNICLYLTSSL
ncbi:hypothetical protein L1887_18866 [Cichorium endivia]|nr:hypothetical protein L1887_18866 [Cichorium endivia]